MKRILCCDWLREWTNGLTLYPGSHTFTIKRSDLDPVHISFTNYNYSNNKELQRTFGLIVMLEPLTLATSSSSY